MIQAEKALFVLVFCISAFILSVHASDLVHTVYLTDSNSAPAFPCDSSPSNPCFGTIHHVILHFSTTASKIKIMLTTLGPFLSCDAIINPDFTIESLLIQGVPQKSSITCYVPFRHLIAIKRNSSITLESIKISNIENPPSDALVSVYSGLNADMVLQIFNSFFINFDLLAPFLSQYSGNLYLANTSWLNIYVNMKSALIIYRNIFGTVNGSGLYFSYVDTNSDLIGTVRIVAKRILFRKIDFEFINFRSLGSRLAALDILALENTTIFDSSFYLCSADTGGAIKVAGNSYIKNSIFSENFAFSQGAAIVYFEGYHTIYNCDFSGNSADEDFSYGGAISTFYLSNLLIFNSTFVENFASYGGVVFTGDECSVEFHNCSLIDNNADYGGIAHVEASILIKDSEIIRSHALVRGGVLECTTLANGMIDNSNISSSFSSSGGVVYSYLSTIISIKDTKIEHSITSGPGGAFFIQESTFELINSECSNQLGGNKGGFLYSVTSAVYISYSSILNSTSVDHSRSFLGGAIFCESCLSMRIENSVLQYGYSDEGALIYCKDTDDLSIFNSSLMDASTLRNGGGIYLKRTSLMMELSVLRNLISHSGSGIYCENDIESSLFVQIRNSYFRNCLASSRGASIYFLGHRIVVDSSEFKENKANLFGAAIYVHDAIILRISSSIFIENSAESGGALYVSNALSLYLVSSVFSKNTAFSVDFSCSSITGFGGAIAILDLPVGLSGLNIQENQFIANTASSFGGAFGFRLTENREDAAFLKETLLLNSHFENNTAQWGRDFGSPSAQGMIDSNVTEVVIGEFAVLRIFIFDIFRNPIRRPFICSAQIISTEDSDLRSVYIEHPVSGRFDLDFSQTNLVSLPVKFERNPQTSASLGSSTTVDLGLRTDDMQIPLLDSFGKERSFKLNIYYCIRGSVLAISRSGEVYCRLCLPGQFSGVGSDNTFRCINCPAGKSSMSGSETCYDCGSGRYTSDFGQEFCVKCPLGKFNQYVGSSSCFECPIGSYSSTLGSTLCDSCPAYSETRNEGSEDVFLCKCQEGYYGSAYLGNMCRSCSVNPGFKCPPNSSAPIVEEGFWMVPLISPPLAHRCFPEIACKSSVGESICGTEYSGVRCGTCIDGYYWSDSRCKRCKQNLASWSLTTLAFLVFLSLLFRVSSPSFVRSSSSSRILIGWVQLLGVLPRASISGSKSMESLDSIFFAGKLANLDLDLIAISCTFGVSFWDSYYLQLMFPLLLALLSVMIRLLYNFYRSLHSKSSSDLEHPPVSPALDAVYLKNLFLRVGLYLILILYPYCLKIAFRPFRCYRQHDGSYTMVENPSSDCFSSEWLKRLPITLGALIFYVVAVPIFVISILWKQRKLPYSDRFNGVYGFLVHPFSPKYYWWELVSIPRRVVFLVFSDLSNNLISHQRYYFILMVLMISLFIEGYLFPYYTLAANRLYVFMGELVCVILLFQFFVIEYSFGNALGSTALSFLIASTFWLSIAYISYRRLRIFIKRALAK